MQRLKNGLAVAAVALAIGSVAAGCGSGVGSAVKSAASNLPSLTSTPALPTRTATVTSEAPTPTAQPPTTSAPSPAAAPSQAATTAAATESGSSLLWLWILLAAVVVIGLIAWIARASGRRSAAATGWRNTVADAFAKGQALADAVRIAERPGAPGDAAGHWAGLQARADDLSQELYRLRESARSEDDRMRVEDTLTSLRALRSAMADEQAAGGAGGPGSPEAVQVRGRLMSFEDSLRALRAPYEQTPRI